MIGGMGAFVSKFEIIAITFSFIVGIGVAQLLSSLASAIRERKKYPLHWIPIVWAFVVLLFSVQYWFALFEFNQIIQDWTWVWYGQFLYLAVALYLAGAFVLPSGSIRVPGGMLADFSLHGRLALPALVAYLAGWIVPNAEFTGGIVSEVNLMNSTMAVFAVLTYSCQNRLIRALTSLSFLTILIYTLIFIYEAPGTNGS
jgi:hypothetical protein